MTALATAAWHVVVQDSAGAVYVAFAAEEWELIGWTDFVAVAQEAFCSVDVCVGDTGDILAFAVSAAPAFVAGAAVG